MRSPFTAIVFAFELTHDQNSLLGLLVAATVAHLISVLTLKRSILTEKVARRGFHVMGEYAVDPLEAMFVREIMDTDICTTDARRSLPEVYLALPEGSVQRRQRLYPVVRQDGALVGVLPWSAVLERRSRAELRVGDVMMEPAAVAFPDEVHRCVADRMASLGLGAMPVVSRSDTGDLEGIITQFNLMRARERLLVEERRAEKVLTLRRVAPRWRGRGGTSGRIGVPGAESGVVARAAPD